ncbi:MAG TPA: CocE/NonD family hydrolase [Pseudonocardiaceae bacterium]|jgi:predicted acyl esterase|nr:CocE/NonD family hydrolase [Pseudonocardiaceae bacterium]
MRGPLVLLLAASTALLGAAAVAPAASAAPPPGYTLTYQTIPGDGGTALKGFVITPTGRPGPFPLVVMPSSWGVNDLEYVGAGEKLAARSGYEVISYTSRGFYDSAGENDVAGPATVADVSKVIDWALANTPADPNEIGAAGISYGAGQSLLAAAVDPRLKAVVAMSGWTDLADSLYPNQTISSIGSALLLLAGDVTSRPGPELRQLQQDFVAGDISRDLSLSPPRSADTKIAQINDNHAAVMVANTWGDSLFPPDQFVDFFNQLTGPKRLELEAGDHATSSLTGAAGLPNATWDDVTRWLDHFVRGVDNGINTENPIQLKPDNGTTWQSYPTWSAVGENTTSYLSAPTGVLPTGSLTGGPSTGWSSRINAGIDTIADSGVPLLSGALQGYADVPTGVAVPLVNRAAAGVWNTPAQPGATTVSGTPSLHLTVTPSTATTSLFGYLYDVNPLGVGSLISYRPDTLRGATPGQPMPVDLSLEPIVWNVPAGDHLTLVVDTVDPRYQSLSPIGSTVTFSSPATDPSWLRIPTN